METKTIDWNELSEQTKLVLPKNVKIYHSIENGCSVLMLEPEKEETVKTFLKGQIVYGFLKGKVFISETDFKDNGKLFREATIEEKDAFLLSKNLMIGENGEVVRWKPKEGDEYYISNTCHKNYATYVCWVDSELDNEYFSRLITFPTFELAKENTLKMLNSLK